LGLSSEGVSRPSRPYPPARRHTHHFTIGQDSSVDIIGKRCIGGCIDAIGTHWQRGLVERRCSCGWWGVGGVGRDSGGAGGSFTAVAVLDARHARGAIAASEARAVGDYAVGRPHGRVREIPVINSTAQVLGVRRLESQTRVVTVQKDLARW
jgi:hypothetical protein